jgi:hypothetical protein
LDELEILFSPVGRAAAVYNIIYHTSPLPNNFREMWVSSLKLFFDRGVIDISVTNQQLEFVQVKGVFSQ